MAFKGVGAVPPEGLLCRPSRELRYTAECGRSTGGSAGAARRVSIRGRAMWLGHSPSWPPGSEKEHPRETKTRPFSKSPVSPRRNL